MNERIPDMNEPAVNAAPNGKPSNLSPEDWAYVRSAEFKASDLPILVQRGAPQPRTPGVPSGEPSGALGCSGPGDRKSVV